MVCVGLDGLTKDPVMAPVVLMMVNTSLLVFSVAGVRLIVLLDARLIWVAMAKG